MISNEIREALQIVYTSLNKYNVDCMVVGGVAVGFYGYQRISGISMIKPDLKTDLDFWYNPTNENFLNLLKALQELDVDTSDLEKIVFDPQKTFLKIPKEKFHIDFLPQMKGLSSYNQCKRNARKELLDGNEVHLIGLNDLLVNKTTVGREIDKNDLDNLTHK